MELGDLSQIEIPKEEQRQTVDEAVRKLIEWANQQPPETFED